MKRPISYLLVGIIVAALVIGVLGAAVSAVTSTGLQSTSTGDSGTDPTSTTTMTTMETSPTETATAQETAMETATMTGQGTGSSTGSGHQFFPFTGTPYPVPGRIEAENYDVGPCNQVGGGQGGSGTGTTTPTATTTTTATSTVTATPTETTSGEGGSGNATATPTTTTTATTTEGTSGQGSSGNGTPTATMTTAATTTAATTTATATATTTSGQGSSGQGSSGNVTGAANITILAPNATSAISGEMVTVMTEVNNFTLVDPATVNDTPAAGQGHIHYFLDAVPPTTPGVPARTGIAGEVLETPNTTIQWANITAGTHTFYAMLVNNDHTPYSPIAMDSVTFQVNATNASGTSGLGTVTTTTTATSGNGTSGQGSGNATSGMSIALLAPNATSAIDGRLVNVAAEVSNFTLVDPDMVNLTPAAGQGHIHYFLDVVPPTTPGVPAVTGIGNTVFETPNTTIQWANVTPGMHTLYAMLVNNDHTPVIPIVVDSVTFQANATNASGTSGQGSSGTGTTTATTTVPGTTATGTAGTGTVTTTATTTTGSSGAGTYGIAGAIVMALLDAGTDSSGHGSAATNQVSYGTETTTPATTATTSTTGQGSSGNQTIVKIAQANSNFSTLVTALQTAGLVETLNGTGPFTVFAPTNAAFDALPSGTLNALLANTTDLTSVLTYHVVPGRYTAAQVASMSSLPTAEGQPLTVTVQPGGGVQVDGATIIQTDIQASNGVIHVIDAVMIPPNTSTAGQGTGNATPTATTTTSGTGGAGQETGTSTPTTTATTTSGQGGAGETSSGQPGAVAGQYGCGQGWAYFDRTPGNQGGAYRHDDVDIENGGTGHVVAFVKSSEWLIYSVHVPENGMYRATFSASSPWNDREIWVWVDGILEAQVKVPNTGSFDSYQDASADVALPVGNHYIRLEFVRDAQNLDFMTFERVGDIPTWPFFGTRTSTQGAGSSGGQVTGTATTTHTTSSEGTSGQGSSGQGTSTATPTATMTSDEGTATTTATTMATTATMGEGSSGQGSGTSTPTVTATATVTSDEGSSDQDTSTPTVTATTTMTSGEGSSGQGTGTMTACPTETVSGRNTSGA